MRAFFVHVFVLRSTLSYFSATVLCVALLMDAYCVQNCWFYFGVQTFCSPTVYFFFVFIYLIVCVRCIFRWIHLHFKYILLFRVKMLNTCFNCVFLYIICILYTYILQVFIEQYSTYHYVQQEISFKKYSFIFRNLIYSQFLIKI